MKRGPSVLKRWTAAALGLLIGAALAAAGPIVLDVETGDLLVLPTRDGAAHSPIALYLPEDYPVALAGHGESDPTRFGLDSTMPTLSKSDSSAESGTAASLQRFNLPTVSS